MKKAITLISLLVLSTALLFAGVRGTNRQEIYRTDSEVYEGVKSLYVSEGLALPSTTGPWNAAELDLMMERLDRDALSGSQLVVYDWVMEELHKDARIEKDDDFALNTGLLISAEMFAHSNADTFTSLDDFGGKGDWREQTPLLSVPIETWIGNHVYGYSSFDLGLNRTFVNGLSGVDFFTNVYMVPPSALNDLNLNFPNRAVGSFGGEKWNIAVGRDRMKWGPGESGNLIIGDQIPYHSNARFTAFSNTFKYTFSMSSFIHPQNYTAGPDENGYEWFDPEYSMTRPRKGISMLIAHRLEWRIVDKVNMALTESIVYQSDNGEIDFLVLSPTAVFHNYYIRGNANSLIGLELDWSPVDCINVYGEFALDEFKLPGEFEGDGPPSSCGFILGLKSSVPLGKGMLAAYAEGAYTDPYLYLRDEGESYGPKKYGVNFVAAIPEFVNQGKLPNYKLEFMGYRWGNDVIAFELGVGYREYGSWFVNGTYTYVADGCFDENTRWSQVVPGSKEDPKAPSTDHPEAGSFDKDSNWQERDAVAHHNILSFKGGITLLGNLDIWGEMNWMGTVNYGNESGKFEDDFQFSLGASWFF